MRADKNVHLPRLHLFDDQFLFLQRAEPGDHLDVDGELRKPLLERFEMLKAKDRGRSQHGDLFAVLHCLESSAHCDFSFSVTHIAAEQAVHRRCRFHVVLDCADRG